MEQQDVMAGSYSPHCLYPFKVGKSALQLVWPARLSCKRPVGVERKGWSSGNMD